MAYNSSTFWDDPNLFSPLYIADEDKAAERLALLESAYADASALPETDSNRAYRVGELESDLAAQRAVVNYLQKKHESESLANLAYYASGYGSAEGYASDVVLGYAKDNYGLLLNWDNILAVHGDNLATMQVRGVIAHELGLPDGAYATPRQVHDAAIGLYNSIGDRTASVTKDQNDLKRAMYDSYHIARPDFDSATAGVEDYYYNPETGQVPLATQNVKEDVYKQAQQARYAANASLNSAGMLRSGARVDAQQSINKEANNRYTGAYDNASKTAASKITDFKQWVNDTKDNLKSTEDQVKLGAYDDLFSDTTNDYTKDYSSKLNSEMQDMKEQAAKEIKDEQESDSIWGGIASKLGSAVGSIL